MSTELGFPTEDIELPSGGKFYPESHPLRTGTIELKYLTAKEEDILTSTNLLQQGTVLDKLCESIIMTKGVKVDDLLIGDLNAVVVASRILGYGKNYPIVVSCPDCGTENTFDVNLTELKDKVTELEANADGVFELLLPGGTPVKFKLLTRKDEKSVEKEIKTLRKTYNDDISRQLSTRIRHMLIEVDGKTDPASIYKFSEQMLVRDTRALREAYQKAQPDLDFDVKYSCTSAVCEGAPTQTVRLPIGPDFFWPDLRV